MASAWIHAPRPAAALPACVVVPLLDKLHLPYFVQVDEEAVSALDLANAVPARTLTAVSRLDRLAHDMGFCVRGVLNVFTA